MGGGTRSTEEEAEVGGYVADIRGGAVSAHRVAGKAKGLGRGEEGRGMSLFILLLGISFIGFLSPGHRLLSSLPGA